MTAALDPIALVGAIERVRRALEALDATVEQARGTVARGATQLDAVSDAARGLPGRGREARASLALLYESLERAKLSALNAGLEAARLGDPAGKLVLELSGDLRELVSGALEALEAHANLLTESERERERWLDGVMQARETIGKLETHLSNAGRERQELAGALTGLEQATAALGTDPKTARLLLEVGEQSKALAQSIGALGREPGVGDERLRQALAPLIEAIGKGPGSKP